MMVPAAGLIDQVTAVLVVPLTVAVNWAVCALESVIEAGDTLTEIAGTRVITAVASLVGSAALLAVTVTLCCDVMEAGAV